MTERMVYIGRKPTCGHIVAVVADLPEWRKDTAKDVAEFVREGYTVERITLEAFKAEGFCECPRPRKQDAVQEALGL